MRTSSATTALLACVALVSVLACSDSNPSNPAAPPPPPGPLSLRLEPVASGFDIPIFLTAPPGDVNRLFVVEKTGRIEIIKNGQVLATPFLSLVGQLALDTEQGLLGMAFDPNYSLNGTFYVCYTEASGGALRVVRYQVSSDPDVALTAPMGNILTQPDSYVNHNGGMIVFGADGMLYVGMGDGGGGGDPLNTGQNRGDLLGSILRLDVSGGGAGYAIPLGNPFSSPDRPEIWTFGLRNPWRFSFDRQTGDLYVGDVGQDDHEEIHVSSAADGAGRGLNFGWRIMEGRSCYNASSCNQNGLTLPVLDYPHSGGACSVTGGYVYRGSAIPALRGAYLYGDYCAGWVRSFRYQGGQATQPQSWPSLTSPGLTSFGEDANGELYILTDGGSVFRIESP